MSPLHVPQPFGVFNVHKPRGMTSRRVVDRVKKLVRPAKAGHAGTLDPLASGVIVVCVGPATRLISYVQDLPKTYRAEFVLGQRSGTDDLEGELVAVSVPTPPTLAEVEAVLPNFVGTIEQVPPMFSAVHVDGQRAYDLARRGRTVELESRPVDVYHLALRRFDYPHLEIDVECGSGTYIRSIGRDLGEILGCGAVMTALERTRTGPFRIEDAVDPAALSLDSMASPGCCIADLPRYVCDEAALGNLVHGRPLTPPDPAPFSDDSPYAVVGVTGELLAIADWRATEGVLKPRHVFVRA